GAAVLRGGRALPRGEREHLRRSAELASFARGGRNATEFPDRSPRTPPAATRGGFVISNQEIPGECSNEGRRKMWLRSCRFLVRHCTLRWARSPKMCFEAKGRGFTGLQKTNLLPKTRYYVLCDH
ncbi:hypothetical protein Z043_119353, partial [Scleropages formosus]